MSSEVPQSSTQVGLIGLGLLGGELAKRLMAGGFRVIGFDSNEERLRAFEAEQGKGAASAGDVFRQCRRVLLCLPSHVECRQVIDAARSFLTAGDIILDVTTGDPTAAEALADELHPVGVSYLDATVSGSSSQLREGLALMMVGGDRVAYDRCTDILNALAPQPFHAGPPGAGAKMKLVTNVVLGLNRAALAEGLALAEAVGLDMAQALEIMRSGPAYSRIMDRKGERMLTGNFIPEARLSQHLKDVRLILKLGNQSGLPMSFSKTHCVLLEQAEAAGLGDMDNSAIIEVMTPVAPKV